METFFAIIGYAGVFALGVATLWFIVALADRVEKLETVIAGHAHRISAESIYSKLLSDTLAKVTDRVEKLES